MASHRARSGHLRPVALRGGLAVAAAVVGAHLVAGLSAAPVLSDSMKPAYQRGDLLVTRLEPRSALKAGDIAVFTPPDMSAPVAHRIVSIHQADGWSALVTKGDANPVVDRWHAVLREVRVPVVVTTVPRVGSVLVALDGDAAAVRAGVVGILGCVLTAIATLVASRRTRERRILTGGTSS